MNDNEEPRVTIIVGRVWRSESAPAERINVLLRAPDDDSAVRMALEALAGEGYARAELDQARVRVSNATVVACALVLSWRLAQVPAGRPRRGAALVPTHRPSGEALLATAVCPRSGFVARGVVPSSARLWCALLWRLDQPCCPDLYR